jgi:hypothetical protein
LEEAPVHVTHEDEQLLQVPVTELAKVPAGHVVTH